MLVNGTRQHAEALRPVVACLLAEVGLRLSEEKTKVAHIDEGFDFLGWRIQRQTQRGSNKRYVYTFPSKKSLTGIKAKVKAITTGGTDQPLAVLLHRLNKVLRGWATYFRHGVSYRTFSYLDHYTWVRVLRWLRRKHRRASWTQLRRRYLPGWRPTEGEVTLFNPAAIGITRYRYQGNIASPWTPKITTT